MEYMEAMRGVGWGVVRGRGADNDVRTAPYSSNDFGALKIQPGVAPCTTGAESISQLQLHKK